MCLASVWFSPESTEPETLTAQSSSLCTPWNNQNRVLPDQNNSSLSSPRAGYGQTTRSESCISLIIDVSGWNMGGEERSIGSHFIRSPCSNDLSCVGLPGVIWLRAWTGRATSKLFLSYAKQVRASDQKWNINPSKRRWQPLTYRRGSCDGDLLYELVEHSLVLQRPEVKGFLVRGSLAYYEWAIVDHQISNIGVRIRRESTLTLGRTVFTSTKYVRIRVTQQCHNSHSRSPASWLKRLSYHALVSG